MSLKKKKQNGMNSTPEDLKGFKELIEIERKIRYKITQKHMYERDSRLEYLSFIIYHH